MTAPQPYRLVELDRTDWAESTALVHWAFPTAVDEAEAVAQPDIMPWPDVFGYRAADGQLAAQCASRHLAELAVPGGSLAAAGLTWVSVHPAHRRRGLLTAMIGQHFDRCQSQGLAVSVLVASEPTIYGRFGYGLASDQIGLTIPRRAPLRAPADDSLDVRVETADPARHGAVVDRLHRAAGTVAGQRRPGWVTRDQIEASTEILLDPPGERFGGEPLRIMLLERSGEPVAYALFARGSDCWTAERFRVTVRVREHAAVDPAATATLWHRLLDLDLTDAVSVDHLAVDDALLSLLTDVDAAQPRRRNQLWARLISLPTALAARRYATAVDVVIDVADWRRPTNLGRWRLQAAAFSDDVTVTRTEEPPDLVLDADHLGALYFGGRSLLQMAAAGLVDVVRPDRLAETSAAFSWPLAPGCSWMF
ncbi:MAG: GNAT family N-acetyltransferase [Propionibacteriaceae bacterium]|jgi:predicted acetyltransferase|nr:GNAT family N-acetyltransferase [Propionibacteriaceae bacterium]